MIEAAQELFSDQAGRCHTAMAQRLRYAKPTHIHTWPFLAHGSLIIGGNWRAYPTLESALESGWATAKYLIDYLKPQEKIAWPFVRAKRSDISTLRKFPLAQSGPSCDTLRGIAWLPSPLRTGIGRI